MSERGRSDAGEPVLLTGGPDAAPATTAFRHLALVVPDVRAAEAFYRRAFAMDVIGREAELEDGKWSSLRPDRGWPDADAAGIEIDFVALRRDDVVLAVTRGEAAAGQVFAVGVAMPEDQIAQVRTRLPSEAAVTREDRAYLEFVDPFGVRWQISSDRRFRTSGDISGRWIEL